MHFRINKIFKFSKKANSKSDDIKWNETSTNNKKLLKNKKIKKQNRTTDYPTTKKPTCLVLSGLNTSL